MIRMLLIKVNNRRGLTTRYRVLPAVILKACTGRPTYCQGKSANPDCALRSHPLIPQVN
jgi:hypothetical protein